VVAVLLSRRRRVEKATTSTWERQRQAVLLDTSDLHDRTTTFLARWPTVGEEELAGMWSSQSNELDRVRDDLRTVLATAPRADRAAPLQDVADAVDDLRVAIANGLRARAMTGENGADSTGRSAADANAALLSSLRRARSDSQVRTG
jgi:hypothetical protein